jgi:hypothetical protein
MGFYNEEIRVAMTRIGEAADSWEETPEGISRSIKDCEFILTELEKIKETF